MTDDLAKFNRERWEELAQKGILYSRPWLNLTPESARERLETHMPLGDLRGKDVLCLAGGGGQQSAALSLLGARVTVLDLCETQLDRDRLAAKLYGHKVRTVQGDMRDLSCFAPGSFDLVWHAHSLVFIPDAGIVFDQVVRVLRPGGRYRLSCANPCSQGLDENSWNGKGYLYVHPYVEGAEVHLPDPYWSLVPWDGRQPIEEWVKADHEGEPKAHVLGPREFRHTFGAIINGLIARGFAVEGLWEEDPGSLDSPPGSWDHFKAYCPPWITVWAKLAK